MNAAFTRSARLTQRIEFDRVFSAPQQRSSDRYFTVLGRFREKGEESRLGMVVAKKKIARAHERNRIKRLIRESFRLEAKNQLSMDIVILPRNRDVQFVDNVELFRSLSKHWKRLQREAYLYRPN